MIAGGGVSGYAGDSAVGAWLRVFLFEFFREGPHDRDDRH